MSKTNLEKHQNDIKSLIEKGNILLKILDGDNQKLLEFRKDYEMWYSEAYALVKTVLPDRLEDFESYYKSHKGDSLRTAITYTPLRQKGIGIEDTLSSVPGRQVDYARSLYENQLSIVKAASQRFLSSLFDIQQLVQSDLFDSELDVAEELKKKGFVRASGAISGVVLEGHLQQVCRQHNITVRKKNPTINDLAQLLKKKVIINTPKWRNIQHLADIRNLCDHKKVQEPSKDEIEELIKGVSKIIKTIF